VIKYIGSKRALVPVIRAAAAQLPARTACDLFAGTTRVGQALRQLGLEVTSNDLATYSEVFGLAYIVADGSLDLAVARCTTVAFVGVPVPNRGRIAYLPSGLGQPVTIELVGLLVPKR